MDPIQERQQFLTRRTFFSLSGGGLGVSALVSLLAKETQASTALPGLPHFAPKAKRVIYLFQHGAPSQLDLFDHKPNLQALRGTDLPESVRMGQRLTGMTAYQTKFPTASSIFRFSQHGQGGAWLSELLPYTGKVAEDLCIIRSMHTEAINHDPAVTFFQTGFQLASHETRQIERILYLFLSVLPQRPNHNRRLLYFQVREYLSSNNLLC